jgi:hypothetical protein
VIDNYDRLIQFLNTEASNTPYYLLQLLFIGYLLVGQGILLLLWWLLGGFRYIESSGGARLLFAFYILCGQVALVLGWPWLITAWLRADRIFLADAMVVIHLSIVVGVLIVTFCTLIARPLGWHWPRHFWLRLAVLLTVVVVAGQPFVALECPLTTLERELRGGDLLDTSRSSLIGQFCNRLLYYPMSFEVMQAVYGTFGLLVLLSWAIVPPEMSRRVTENTAAKQT